MKAYEIISHPDGTKTLNTWPLVGELVRVRNENGEGYLQCHEGKPKAFLYLDEVAFVKEESDK